MTEIFVTVLSVSLSSALLILALLLLAPVFNRRYASKWIFWAWVIIAARLLIPINGLPERTEPAKEPSGVILAEAPAPAPAVNYPRIEISIPERMSEPVTVSPPAAEKRREVTPLGVAAAVWIIGAAAVFAAQTAAFAAAKRKVIKCAVPLSSEDDDVFKSLSSEFGAGRSLRLMRSSGADCPMLMGYLRPLLVIPADGCTGEQLKYIIRHELTHYSRKDVWSKLLFAAAVSVHWFNPAVWLMRRRADIDMELAVDEGVVGSCGTDIRKEYSEALFASVSSGRAAHGALSTRFGGSKKVLKKRFYNILKIFNKKNGAMILAAALILTVAAGALIGCTADLKKTPDGGISQKTAEELVKDDFEIRRQMFVSPPEYDPDDSVALAGSLHGTYYRITGGFEYSADEWDGLLESVYTGNALEERASESPFMWPEDSGNPYCGTEDFGSPEMTLESVTVVGLLPDGSGTVIRAVYSAVGEEHIADYSAVLTDDGWRISEVRDYDGDPTGTADAALSRLMADGSLELANEILTFSVSAPYADEEQKHGDTELEVTRDGETYMSTFIPMKSPYDTKKSCMDALGNVFTKEACEKRESLFEESETCRVVDGVLYYEASEPLRYMFVYPFRSAEKTAPDEITAKTEFVWQDGTNSDCEIVLKEEGGEWKIDKIIDPNSQRDDPECICAFPITREELGYSTEVDEQGSALLEKLSEAVGGEEIYAFAAADFDRDGSYEAFGATGEAYFDGTLWFVNGDGVSEVAEDGFYLAYEDMSRHILDFGETVLYTIEESYGTVGFSRIFGVKDGKPFEHEFSGKVSDIVQTGTYNAEGKDSGGYDAVIDPDGVGTGHTYKTYYFYYNGGFREYGGIDISEEELLAVDGAADILDGIRSRGETVSEIIWRGDIGIVNINSYISDEDGSRRNYYSTVLIEAGKAYEIGRNDGVIAKAFIPEIADYPEGFEGGGR